jgi:hypothetical protein
MLARIIGLRCAGQVEEAQGELEKAYSSLLGRDPSLVLGIDGETAALLVGDPARLAALAQLLQEDGNLRLAQGSPDSGDFHHRALVIALEALRRDGSNETARTVARELAASAGPDRLTERHRDLLAAILRDSA